MPRSLIDVLRSACVALTLASILPAPAWAASVLAKPGDPPPGLRHPLHLSVLVGWVAPCEWPGLDDGYLIGGRLSFDPSPVVTPFAEVQVGTVRGTEMVPYSNLYGTGRYRLSTVQAYTTLTVGSRFHLERSSMIRPYVEAGATVRFAGDENDYRSYLRTFSEEQTSDVEHEGACGVVRGGISTAPFDGVGVWLDVGWEFVVRNPGRRGMLPVRLGIQLL